MVQSKLAALPEIGLEERKTRQIPPEPWQKGGDDGGPARPNVQRPDTRELLRRMRRVDPQQARRYRQRSGE